MEEKTSMLEKIAAGVVVTGLSWMIGLGACVGMSKYHSVMADNYQTKAIEIAGKNSTTEVIPYKEMAKTTGKYWGLHNEHKQDAKDWSGYADKLALYDEIKDLRGGKK